MVLSELDLACAGLTMTEGASSQIWAPAALRLPSLEELCPDVANAASVPDTHGMIMQRLPGHPSYSKVIGDTCGSFEKEPRTQEAWRYFAGLPQTDYDALANNFPRQNCRDLTDAQRDGVSDYVRLLLSPAGQDLLRSVARALYEHTAEECWAWDVAGEGPAKYSPVWCVKRVLRSIMQAMVRNRLLSDWTNRANGGRDCCVCATEGCLEYHVPGAPGTWDSLHPCARRRR